MNRISKVTEIVGACLISNATNIRSLMSSQIERYSLIKHQIKKKKGKHEHLKKKNPKGGIFGYDQ